jgi:hypothetical protein
LSIREGRRGKVLLHCFAGCRIEAILSAVGLRMSDLFPGSPPSSAEQAAMAKARDDEDIWREYLHNLNGRGCDRLHSLRDFSESLARRLMLMLYSEEAERLTALFHRTLDQIRYLESALATFEKAFSKRSGDAVR